MESLHVSRSKENSTSLALILVKEVSITSIILINKEMLIIQNNVNTFLSDRKGHSLVLEINVVGTSFRVASLDLTFRVSVVSALTFKVHHVGALVLVNVVQFSDFQELRLWSHFALTVLLLELRSVAHLIESTFLGLGVLNKHLVLTELVFIESLPFLVFVNDIDILSLSDANLSFAINQKSYFLILRVDVKSSTFSVDWQDSSLGIVVAALIVNEKLMSVTETVLVV